MYALSATIHSKGGRFTISSGTSCNNKDEQLNDDDCEDCEEAVDGEEGFEEDREDVSEESSASQEATVRKRVKAPSGSMVVPPASPRRLISVW